MEFTRDGEHQLWVETVRRFAEDVLAPRAEAHDRGEPVDPVLGPTLGELGVFSLRVAEDAGGLDAPWVWALDTVEALAVWDPSVAWMAASHLWVCGAASRAPSPPADLEKAVAGQVWWTAVSPPGVVPTATSPRVWSPDAGFMEAPESGADAPGVLGLRGARLARWSAGPQEPAMADPWLKALAAAVSLGLGRQALVAASAYAQERTQFGRPISDFQAIQWKFADRATELDGARLLLHHGARTPDPFSLEHGGRRSVHAGVAATWDAIQVFGGNGFIREYPVERAWRDAQTVRAWLWGSF